MVFSSTTIQKHQFFGTQPSLWPNCHKQYMTTGTMSGGLVAKLCPTLATSETGNLPGSSVRGILQAKILE